MYIDAIPNESGAYSVPQSNDFQGSVYLPDDMLPEFIRYNGFVVLTIDDGVVTYIEPNMEAWEEWKAEQPEPEPESSPYIPTPEKSAVVMMRSMFVVQSAEMDNDTIIQCSGLADDWKPGNHKSGEIYNAGDQTWECFQDYDNAVYPDIKPGNPAWYTFNRPLHGKSPETARPFVPVQGAHDMYRAGEHAIWTDGLTYRCKSDTNFSPSDYPDAWEVDNGK